MKKNLVFVCLLLVLASNAIGQTIEFVESTCGGGTGPIAYYPFDGDVNDYSGNDLHGTKTSAVVYSDDRCGNADSAVHFTSSTDAYIELGNQPELNNTGNLFTITFWTKIDSYSGGWIIDHDIDGPLAYDWCIAIRSSGEIGYRVRDVIEYGNTPIIDGTWHHVAIRRDRNTGKLGMFIDGQLDRELTGYDEDSVYSHNMTIGVNDEAGGGPSGGFAGHLDELRFYDRALSECEIEELANISIPFPPEEDDGKPIHPKKQSKLLLWQNGGFVNIENAVMFNSEKDAVIIIHGWNSDTDEPWVQEMATAIASKEPTANVFAWDWRKIANHWPNGTETVQEEADKLGEALAHPDKPAIRDATSIKFIGHSLGAAVSSRTADLLECNNIQVKRVSLLDPPELKLTGNSNKKVNLYDIVKDLSQSGVKVDNYLTQFGDTYKYGINFDLRDAADQPKGKAGPIDDHKLSHAWYIKTIKPVTDSLPGIDDNDTEGKFLYKYYEHFIKSANVFWSGVGTAGFALNDFSLSLRKPKSLPDHSENYYPYLFVKPYATPIDPEYTTVLSDDFGTIGNWTVDGAAYLQNGEAHLLTNSPTYLFETITIPEDADVLRFQYRFEGSHEDDRLLVYADDELLWVSTATSFNDGIMQDTGWIDIQNLAGQTVKLYFVLVNGTIEQAHAVIDNLEFADEIGNENNAPLANAGPDQTLSVGSSCSAEVSLDGSGSSDADSDELGYIWVLDDIVLARGVSPTVELPLGTHSISLIVRDWLTDSEADEVVVTVEDNTPPVITLSVAPELLWPPNHKMVKISSFISASDGCDGSVDVVLKSITMNEGEETNTYDPTIDTTQGDGHTLDDIQVIDDQIYLRAERSGKGDGRIYTITYEAEDASGNTAQASATVIVPHNQH